MSNNGVKVYITGISAAEAEKGLLLRFVEKLDELGISMRKVLAVFSPKGITAIRPSLTS